MKKILLTCLLSLMFPISGVLANMIHSQIQGINFDPNSLTMPCQLLTYQPNGKGGQTETISTLLIPTTTNGSPIWPIQKVCTTANGYIGGQQFHYDLSMRDENGATHLSCYYSDTCVTTQKCGDGVINGKEVCDGDTIACTLNESVGTKTCKPDCSGYQDECAFSTGGYAASPIPLTSAITEPVPAPQNHQQINVQTTTTQSIAPTLQDKQSILKTQISIIQAQIIQLMQELIQILKNNRQ